MSWLGLQGGNCSNSRDDAPKVVMTVALMVMFSGCCLTMKYRMTSATSQRISLLVLSVNELCAARLLWLRLFEMRLCGRRSTCVSRGVLKSAPLLYIHMHIHLFAESERHNSCACMCVCTACLRASKCAIQTCARLNKNGYTLLALCRYLHLHAVFLPSLSSCICMHIVVVFFVFVFFFSSSYLLTAECNLETSKYCIFIYVWEFALMCSLGVATWLVLFLWFLLFFFVVVHVDNHYSSTHFFVLWEKGNVIACVYPFFINNIKAFTETFR